MLVSVITPTNAGIFPEYIIPNIKHLAMDSDVLVRCTYAQCIVPLADASVRYLEMAQAMKAHGAYKFGNADPSSLDDVGFFPVRSIFCFSSTQQGFLRFEYRRSPGHDSRTAVVPSRRPIEYRQAGCLAQHIVALHLLWPAESQ